MNTVVETFAPIADKLKIEQVTSFAKDTPIQSNLFFFQVLFEKINDFTEPPGCSISVPENHLVNMFTSGTYQEVKRKFLMSLSNKHHH